MIDTAVLMVHPEREEAAACAEEASRILRSKGVRPVFPQRGDRVPEEGSTVILTLGGDGTLLLGAEYAIRLRAPLLGINLGTVGFLTEGESSQMPSMVNRLIRGEYTEESRQLLRVRVNDEEEPMYAFNDAVITRGGYARLIRVETYVNDEYLGTCTADGIIASTPTGSTGYALSAGGPVTDPSVRCVIMTPVCAHSLQHASYVISDKALLRFHLRADRNQSAELQIDGRNRRSLLAGDTVYVTGAEQEIRLIRFQESRFFTLTRKKLSEWSGGEEERLPG